MWVIGHSIRIMCAALLLCLSMALAHAPAQAAATDLKPCFKAAMAGEDIYTIIKQPKSFACSVHQNMLEPGTYWVRLNVPKSLETANRGLVFRTASLWDDGLELWTAHKDGSLRHFDPEIDMDINPYRLGSTMVVPISPAPTPIVSIFVKVHNSAVMQGILEESQLSTTEDALAFEMMLAMLYSAFAGLTIALLVYNLALWRGMREPFLLAYCGMLIITLSYAFYTSGAPHYIWPSMTGPDRLKVTTVLLGLNAASGLIFIRYFFEAASIPAKLIKATYIVASVIVVEAAIHASVAPAYMHVMNALYAITFIPIPVMITAYIIVAYRKRDPYVGYFLLAWTAPAIAIICRVLSEMDIISYSMMVENSTLIALAIEALISSLAIGYRVRMITVARDRAEIAKAGALVMADTDGLTSLPNRRAFVRCLLEKPGTWQLMLIDIDHFKRINDTLGHVDGDEVLVRIAAVIRQFAGPDATIARLGGEEFAIAIIAGSAAAKALAADTLLNAIRAAEMPAGYRITASVGSATRAVINESDWKILYRAADMALYCAKAQGRNRHVEYSADRVAA
jgi:diguanylate cyclase (GGDEF)-like protein